MERSADAIVIGGGVAGSTAAYHLARTARSVLLLEKEREPHHKVCGEFISPEAVPLLHEMGIDLDRLGASLIDRCRLYSDRFSSPVSLPAPARGLSRFALDEALLARAEEQGARLHRGIQVAGFHKDPASPRFRVTTPQGDFFSNVLYVATGKHDLKSVHLRQGKGRAMVGFKIHLRLSPENQPEFKTQIGLFFYKGGYAGISPVEEGRSNLCFILEKRIVRNLGGRFESVLGYLQSRNRSLKKVLKDAEWLWLKPVVVGYIPYGYLYRPDPHLRQIDHETGIFYLGDQTAVIPSFTGEGISIALWTAKLAASGGSSGGFISEAEFYRRTREAFGSNIDLGIWMHRLLSLPGFLDLVVGFNRWFPQTGNLIFQKTRPPLFPVSESIGEKSTPQI